MLLQIKSNIERYNDTFELDILARLQRSYKFFPTQYSAKQISKFKSLLD